jgi:FAD dependent oxidoreductase TIGR03364
LLTPGQITARFPAVCPGGLRTGLWSPTEVTVDPRQVLAELPGWLAHKYGVEFMFDTRVLRYEYPFVITADTSCAAHRLVICTGEDFRELAPSAFASSGLVRCKLQMIRSNPCGDRFRLGPMLAAGLTLRHYRAFGNCPTLSALVQRLDREMPDYGRLGIHVLVAQNGQGEVVIGDSHEYGNAIEPFDKTEIEELILAYLRKFVTIPDLTIASRWHGVYVKHPTEAYLVAHPAPEMLAVTGVGGAGMTLSMGLAEQTVISWLGPVGRLS